MPEIERMIREGKTQREIAEHFRLEDKEVVRELLKRERRRQRKLEAGILPRPRGGLYLPATFVQPNEMIDRYIHFYNYERIQYKTGVAPLTLRHSC